MNKIHENTINASVFPDNTFKYKPNLKKRILATLIDYGLYILFFIAYISYFGHENNKGGREVNGVLVLPLIVFWFIYFIVIESIYGATLGHKALQLKVIRLNRNKISFPDALKRHLMDCIDILFYGIPAIVCIKNSDKHQRIGDMWAKTIVIDQTDSEQNN